MQKRVRITPEMQSQIDFWMKRKRALEGQFNLSDAQRHELTNIDRNLNVSREMIGRVKESIIRPVVNGVPLQYVDYRVIADLERARRDGWSFIFSCNPDYENWKNRGKGYTNHIDRQPLPMRFQVLADDIVECYLAVRPSGGRCFVNETGAFYKDENSVWHSVVTFSTKLGDRCDTY